MKCTTLGTLLATPTLMLALAAQAHDPKEHMQGAEKPDCAAMENMDHAKMDMNDPVMQAMMQKCMEQMHQSESDAHQEQDGQDTEDENAGAVEHRHGD